MVMISVGTAFAASEEVPTQTPATASAVPEPTIDDTSNAQNSYATDELNENGGDATSGNGEIKNTTIRAFENVSYARPLVAEDLGVFVFDLTPTNSSLPYFVEKDITVQFGSELPVNCTTFLGVGEYTIPNSTVAGNYSITLTFAGDAEYAGSTFTTMIEVYDVETEITSLGNLSYPRPLVIESLGYYPLVLNTNTAIPIPLANRTVWVSFNKGEYEELTTNEDGVALYLISNDTAVGTYSINAWYDGEDGYIRSQLTTTVEVYDIETEIYSFGNVTYDRPSVIDGDAIYPIMLATNTTIPIPLANRTVWISFDGEDVENYTTDSLGLIYYVIPEDVEADIYNISMYYTPEKEGYLPSKLDVTVEIYDLETEFTALGNLSYPRPLVIEGYGYYPILFTGDYKYEVNGTIINISAPLANKTVFIAFDDEDYENYTTDLFGLVYYVIPEDAEADIHNITMFYMPEEGYVYSQLGVTVDIYDVETEITSLGNLSYPRPLVVEGLGYYPILLTADYYDIDVNGTIIPITLPLANRTVYAQFDDEEVVYVTTDALGIAYYVIPEDAEAGNHTIVFFYDADAGYVSSELDVSVELYDIPTQIFAEDNMSYPRPLVVEGLGYYPILLTTDLGFDIFNVTIPIDIPLANKTVYVQFDDEEVVYVTTDALGIAYYVIPEDAEAGNHTIWMYYDGEEDGYTGSNVTVTVSLYDVETEITSLGNLSYPLPLVIEGYGYYPVILTTNTTVPIPLANRTVYAQFDDEEGVYITTDEFGIAYYVIPEDAISGDHTIVFFYDADAGYVSSELDVSVNLYNVPTQIIAANMSYAHPLVIEGVGYYPILLTTDLGFDIFNVTIPIDIPLANRTVYVQFDDEEIVYVTTNALGIAYYVIPEDAEVGNHTIWILYDGENGYVYSNVTTTIEIYDVATKIISPEDVTFSASDVYSEEAIFPIFLTTNTTIPIPLSDKTILVDFDGIVDEYTTNWLGMVSCVVPEGLTSGNYTVHITFMEDGYIGSEAVTNVEIIGIDTEIIAAENMTIMVSDLEDTQFNLTLIDEYGNVLANKTVIVEFNGVSDEYVTDENGMVFYTLSNATAGNYVIEMCFQGIDNYTTSTAYTELTLVKAQSKIYLRNALYFVLQNKIVNVTLWDANNNPVVGKTVHITIGDLTWSGVTDETGTAHIRVGIGYGVHTATVHFDGDDEYAASNRTGSVRVIKETPSVMVRGADAQFKVSDNPKVVKVYLWDRTSKPLPANSKIVVKVNGQTYVGFTDSQGIASIKIDLNKVGTFNAEVKYGGNSAYNAVTRSVKFVVQ